MTTVLVVGATGSSERLVVEEAIRQGYTTGALVRDRAKARALPADAEVVVGDVTRPDTLAAAVDGIDAAVLTLGSHGSKTEVEKVDSGGVRNILNALGPREARIAMMTAIGLLGQEDLEEAAAALESGTVAGVLVWENRWAAPVAVALRRSGGQLVASGRIPIQAIVAALDATD